MLCGCSMCFGYTPCGPGSGYAGVLRYLPSGLWHCSRYVVIGFGLVPVPVASCRSPPCCLPPPGLGCVGGAGVIVRVVVGRWILAFAVYRVGGMWVWRAWCVLPASGVSEIIGAGRALCPPLAGC